VKRYQTCIPDEVAVKFDEFCVQQQLTPYAFLSNVIHNATAAPKEPRRKRTRKE
jgi:hypothetical protein